MSEAHIILPGSKRPPNPNVIRIGAVDPKARMEVTFALRGPRLPGADDVRFERHHFGQQYLESIADEGMQGPIRIRCGDRLGCTGRGQTAERSATSLKIKRP
jgi:hypothetical protein